jgi:HI0933-like protein
VGLLEHNGQPGRKILISGGGRCNFTNLHCGPQNFISENPHFAKSALALYQPRHFIELVDRYWIAWHEKTLGQLSCDGSSRAIVEMLLAEYARGSVELFLNARGIAVEGGGGFRVESSAGEFAAPALVLATGGLSIPSLGATGSTAQKTLWSKIERRQLEALPLAPWATQRRQDLLELVDRLNTTIDELTAPAEQEARIRPEVLRLMTHPAWGPSTALAFVGAWISGSLRLRPSDRYLTSACHAYVGTGQGPDDMDRYDQGPTADWKKMLIAALPHLHYVVEPGLGSPVLEVELSAGAAEAVGLVAWAVVGEHATDTDAELVEPGGGEEVSGTALGLVGVHGGDGKPKVVVDGDMQELGSDAKPPRGWVHAYANARWMIDGVPHLQTTVPDVAAADAFIQEAQKAASAVTRMTLSIRCARR